MPGNAARCDPTAFHLCGGEEWRRFSLMKLKIASFVLLLLFLAIGNQASGAACAVRCAMMTGAGFHQQMPGMAHCGHASIPSGRSPVALALQRLPQPCASHLCKADWTFIENHQAYELGGVSLPVLRAIHTVRPMVDSSHSLFAVRRSMQPVRSFEPLVSNLRI